MQSSNLNASYDMMNTPISAIINPVPSTQVPPIFSPKKKESLIAGKIPLRDKRKTMGEEVNLPIEPVKLNHIGIEISEEDYTNISNPKTGSQERFDAPKFAHSTVLRGKKNIKV